MRSAGLILLAALLAVVLAAPAGAQDSGAIFEQAEAAFGAGDYPEALTLYRRAVDMDPGFLRAWKRLGLVLSWENRLDESLEAYEKARAIAPDDRSILLDQARVYSWKGDQGRAEALYREVLQQDPESRDARIGLARSLSWANRFDDAAAAYDDLLERDPGDREAALGKARVLAWDNRFDDSKAVYGSLLERDPADLDARLGLAQVLAWQDHLDEALEEYRRVLADAPENAEAHQGYGQVRSWQGLDREAFEHARRALALDPGNAEARRLLRLLDLRHAPTLSPVYSSSLDSDGNSLQSRGLSASFDVEPQTRIGVAFENADTFNGPQDLSGGANITSATLSTRFSEELAATARLGTVTMTPEAAPGQATTVGGADLQWSPTTRDLVLAGYGREVLLGTPDLVANNVIMDTWGLSYRRRLPEGNQLLFSYSRSLFSDSNRRNAYLANYTHLFRAWRPRVAVGATHRWFEYSTRTRSGYFNPPRFTTTEAFLEVTNDDLEDPWIYSFGAAAGFQKVDAEQAQFIHRLSGSLGYRFTDSFALQVSGLTSNSALSSISGYSYNQGMVLGTFRF